MVFINHYAAQQPTGETIIT